YRILVADDKEANRRVLVELLPSLGFDVREAATGREAVEVWTEWRPDLVFMDMHMPEMNGYEATREIRQREGVGGRGAGVGEGTQDFQSSVPTQPPAPRPPTPVRIVALSASVFERDRKGILESGCDDFVGKPFRQEVIFEKLATHLGARFRYEELARPTGT